MSLMLLFSMAQASFFTDADAFFKKHVTNGRVDYAAIKADPAELLDLVKQIGSYSLSGKSAADEKAFYINAYNVLMVASVVEKYPISKPTDVPGVFDSKKHTVAGSSLTLSDIENKKLRPKYKDARLHFALVCGAVSCPKLPSYAFMPAKLESQLDARTKLAMNDPTFIKVKTSDNKVLVSEIFTWYKEDFDREASSVIEYINKFRTQPIPADYKVSKYTYNWALNVKKKVDNGTGMNGDSPGEGGEDPSDDGFNTQFYSGGVLLARGMFEAKLFNNLYTQNAWYNQDSEREDLNRSSFFGSSLSLFYGLSSRVNIGVDANFRGVQYGPAESSPWSTLAFRDTDTSRAALATLGPKIKFTPFLSEPNLTLQSSLWIPVAKNLEDRQNGFQRFLDYDRYLWWLSFFYTKGVLDDKIQIFAATEFVTRFDKFGDGYTDMIIFNKGILSWFPAESVTLYTMVEYAPTVKLQPNGFQSVYGQMGWGGKYIINNQLIFDVMYTRFLFGNSAGAGETFNFGISYVGRLIK